MKDLIISHLRKDVKVKFPKSPKEFRLNPSTLNKCKRAVWYEYHMLPSDDYTDNNVVKLAMGDSVHLFIQKILTDLSDDGKLKIVSIEEDKSKKLPGADFEFKYRIDAIVELENTTKYILEIKSTWARGADRVFIQADENHVSQLKTYMALEDICDGIIIYVSRDNGSIVEHLFHIDSDELKKHKQLLIEYGNNLKKIVQKDELPERGFNLVVTKTEDKMVFDKSAWQCRYCLYRSACYENKSKR